ncbi:NAD/NADP octopine/nopaline dehydrogenase family protein [Agrobacterium vitis]|uniref:NAD/NADP octopine/nopaline dehydrogenase family protein n=1 Tax=Agrobacterium vitis TaxID=373 RepID=UPI0012E7CB44|nr:NAD/NADP octopine/nopaline dehydrogenase family protein [Agrobacterium vitis]MVA52707.1 hypothetical protein [Agrobacterium vitis]MVA64081.1 hypothetical protein [Agrobacterium vitis]
MLKRLFPSDVFPISPLQVLLYANYIFHAIGAVLNIGRLPDKDEELTERAEGWRSELRRRAPTREKYYFYGEGNNTSVCRVQNCVDEERLAIAEACGFNLRPLLDECNEEYATDFENLREYSLAPAPHNVNFACPDTINHRYFLEELCNIEVILSVADAVGFSAPLTMGFAKIIRAAAGYPEPVQKHLFTVDDLIKFGAFRKNLPESCLDDLA